jgi:hypothetical protein
MIKSSMKTYNIKPMLFTICNTHTYIHIYIHTYIHIITEMKCFLKLSSLVIFVCLSKKWPPPHEGEKQKARKTNYQETDVASGLRTNKTDVTEQISLRNGQITKLNVARAPFIFVKSRTQETPSTEGLIYRNATASIF